MTARVPVSVVCLHRGDGDPTTILTREVYPGGGSPSLEALRRWIDEHPDADPEGEIPPDVLPLFMDAMKDSTLALEHGSRGRWIRDGKVVTKFGDVRAGAHGQHQLRCDCGVTERVAERDLAAALEHAAAQPDTPLGKVVPLGGIERYARLIE